MSLLMLWLLILQEPQVNESMNVVVKQIQVTVEDQQGNPVKDLEAKDFEVFLNGKKEDVQSVFKVALPAPGQPLTEELPPAGHRMFVFFFDFFFGGPATQQAIGAAHRFLEENMRETDRVAIFTLNAGGLTMNHNFSSDKASLHRALPGGAQKSNEPTKERKKTRTYNKNDPFYGARESGTSAYGDGSAEAVALTGSAMGRRTAGLLIAYSDAIKHMSQGLALVDGRKNVLYFSSGFDISKLGEEAMIGLAMDIAYMGRELRRSGSTVYAIDTKGAGNSLLNGISSDTGGFVSVNAFNRMDELLDEIEIRNRFYYVINVSLVNPRTGGRLNRLKVKAGRGLKVSSPKALVLQPKLGDLSPMQEAMMLGSSNYFDQVVKPFGIEMKSFPQFTGDQSGLRVVVEMNRDVLSLGAKKGDFFREFDILSEIRNFDTGKVVGMRRHQFEVIPSQLDDEIQGVKHFSDVTLPAGTYTVNTMVRHIDSGKVAKLRDQVDILENSEVIGPLPLSDASWVLATVGTIKNGISKDRVILAHKKTIATKPLIASDQPLTFMFRCLGSARFASETGLAFSFMNEDGELSKVPMDAVKMDVVANGEESFDVFVELDTSTMGLKSYQNYRLEAMMNRDGKTILVNGFDFQKR